MQRASTDVLYFETGPGNRPTLRVEPGETFEVQTQLNRGPWLDTHPDGARLTALLRGGNPSSGCIYVEGAEPGMVLTVHVGAISLDPLGFTRFRGSNGALPGWLGGSGVGPQHKIVTIRDGSIHWEPGRTLPARPMLGFVGTSPAFETWANVWAGTYGGNLDVQELTTGAAITLPVNVPGGAASCRRHARDSRRWRNLPARGESRRRAWCGCAASCRRCPPGSPGQELKTRRIG